MCLFRFVLPFCGYGVLELGFEMTGKYKCVFACDVYEPSLKTFSKNFGIELRSTPEAGVAYPAGVEGVDFRDIAEPGKVDVLTGGPPCQDFSILRGGDKRLGIEVQRGKLYIHFVRALTELKPKAFVFENVKGIASANKGRAIELIISDLSEDYELVFYGVVDFSKLGVPQKRERFIAVGLRRELLEDRDLKHLKHLFRSELKPLSGVFASFPLTPIEVFEGKTIDGLQAEYKEVVEEYGPLMEDTPTGSERDIWKAYAKACGAPEEAVNSWRDRILEAHEAVLQELRYFGNPVSDLNLPDGTCSVLPETEAVVKRMAAIPPGGNYEAVQGTEHEVSGLMSGIYRRIHPLIPSPTVIARGGGGTWGYHYRRGRQRLTNRERARLQTFPDSFTFIGTSSEIRRQIGEAVPPLAAKRIAEALSKALERLK